MPFIEATAKDFGTQGTVYEIEEVDMLDMIKNKLASMQASGELALKQEEMKKVAEARIMRPKRVESVVHTVEERTYEYDPTIIVEEDIKDHKGRLIKEKGTRVNPLEIGKAYSIIKPLLFIDGDSKEQVKWALDYVKNIDDKAIVILVNGSPIELMKKYKRRFYFDQSGSLTGKLGIKQVPAEAVHVGSVIQIKELVLGE
jgi:conjugal transfer pilus assembly protein TraW